MNEFIEELWKEFMCTPLVNGGYTKKDGFVKAIQTACKAQRNACAREADWLLLSDKQVSKIKTAQIERQDYE